MHMASAGPVATVRTIGNRPTGIVEGNKGGHAR